VEPGFIFAYSVYTDIVPSNHCTGYANAETYEMEFPEMADMMPPEGYYALLEAFLFLDNSKCRF